MYMGGLAISTYVIYLRNLNMYNSFMNSTFWKLIISLTFHVMYLIL